MSKDKQDRNYQLPKIDLNCDLAQSWGAFKHSDDDEKLLPYVTSVNIACGGHAGDVASITHAVNLAKTYNLAIGAHIGYPDPLNFGRKESSMPINELVGHIVSQIGLLSGIAESVGLQVTHVRPHAALAYKCAMDNNLVARIAAAITSIDPWMAFVSSAGVYLNSVHEETGILTIGEMGLDVTYKKDGTKKQFSNTKHQSLEFAMSQALALIYNNRVIQENGKKNRTSFRTIHLTSNKDYSLELAKYVHSLLVENNRLGYYHPFFKHDNIQPSDFQPEGQISEQIDFYSS